MEIHTFECASDLVYVLAEQLCATLLVESAPSVYYQAFGQKCQDNIHVEIMEQGHARYPFPTEHVQTMLTLKQVSALEYSSL